MNLYLDDNIADPRLASALRRAGHRAVVPRDFSLTGATDPRHFIGAIQSGLVMLTRDRRDMTPRGIATAIDKLAAADVPVVNQVHVLNHWR